MKSDADVNNLNNPVASSLLSRKIWRFHQKPEPRPLLTEEEYQKQAEEETRRGLEELRKHCNSPEFNPWKTVSRLQSPKRFICDVLLYISPKLMKKKKH